MPMICKDGKVVEATAEDQLPPPPTLADLDAKAQAAADQMFSQDPQTAALGLVMADLIERVFNVSQAAARQQVRDRYRAYYRGLLNR